MVKLTMYVQNNSLMTANVVEVTEAYLGCSGRQPQIQILALQQHRVMLGRLLGLIILPPRSLAALIVAGDQATTKSIMPT